MDYDNNSNQLSGQGQDNLGSSPVSDLPADSSSPHNPAGAQPEHVDSNGQSASRRHNAAKNRSVSSRNTAGVPVYVSPPPKPPRRSFIGGVIKYLFIIAVILSILMNLYLVGLLAGGVQEQVYRSGNREKKIALINLSGTITMQTASQMHKMIQQAADDKAVKAVILVVNSPGGQVVPSNMINHYIDKFKARTHKPFYACIQQMGASGAYWISSAADKIYAQTNSIVGSIGVIYINFVVENALREKLGITPLVIKSSRSPFKDENSPFRMPTEKEKQTVIKDLDTVHKRFVEVISRGRKIPVEKVWEFANGKVFDGPTALKNRLIDAVGFLDDAIRDVARLQNISNPLVVRYLETPKLSDILSLKAHSAPMSLNFERALQDWATQPKIQTLYLGR